MAVPSHSIPFQSAPGRTTGLMKQQTLYDIPRDIIGNRPENDFMLDLPTSEKDTLENVFNEEPSDYFCKTCDTPFFVGDERLHDDHMIENLQAAASRKRNDLAIMETKLKTVVRTCFNIMETERRRVAEIEAKFTLVESTIKQRCEAVVKAAERNRESALKNLQLIRNTVRHDYQKNVTVHQMKLTNLKCVQEKVKEALTPGERESATFKMSKLMSSKTGRQLLEPPETVTLQYPVLVTDATLAEVQDRVRAYVGTANLIPMEIESPEMIHEIQVDHKGVSESLCEIMTFCHAEKDKTKLDAVAISYMTEEGRNHAIMVSQSGEVFGRKKDIAVKEYQHVKRLDNGQLIQPIIIPGVTSSYSKSTTRTHFRLNSGYNGQGQIWRVDGNPLQTKSKAVLTIICGRHRAFDVTKDGKAFIVLEEGESPGHRCKVQMYRKKSVNPVTTYQPPCHPFRPTDICFYQLGGQHVLLVADEANDKIHVVDVQRDRLIFLRYLALGSCMLFQPVALHVDVSNKLWVACRAGDVFTLYPDPHLHVKAIPCAEDKHTVYSASDATTCQNNLFCYDNKAMHQSDWYTCTTA